MKVRNRLCEVVVATALLATPLAGCAGTGEPAADGDITGSQATETPSSGPPPSTSPPTPAATPTPSEASPSATASNKPPALCKDLGFVLRAAKDLRRLGEPVESTGNEMIDEHGFIMAFMEAQVFARTIVESGGAITSDVPASVRKSLETAVSAGRRAQHALTKDEDLNAAVEAVSTTELRAAEKDLHRFDKKACG